jgi:hypothetical protein
VHVDVFTTGSIAAGWQSFIGLVEAGSLFAGLQSMGMLYAVATPVAGTVVIGGTSVAVYMEDEIKKAKAKARHTASKVWRMAKYWWKGDYKKD